MTGDPRVHPAAADSAPDAAYIGYERWKRWDRTFTCTDEEARYYLGETRGLRIADADVLEIGFGAGSFLAWARAQGARVAGTEIIPALIENARAQGVELVPPQLDAVAAHYAGRFDTIVAFDVFEHFALDVVRDRLARCETMLKPGGHLVLRFPNAQSPFGLAPQYGDPTHRSGLSRSVIEQLSQDTRFAVLRYGPAYRVPGRGLGQRCARALRHLARDVISGSLNAIYTQQIPWDPVVVLVLRKEPLRNGTSKA